MGLPKEQQRYTLEEYFAREEDTEYPNEYIDGEILPRIGITVDHNRINTNLGVALMRAVDNKDCDVFMCSLRVEAQPNIYYLYPDIAVVCGNLELAKNIHQDTLTNPSVIIEIMSDSTEAYDRGSKFEAYRQIETFREYVLIDQQRVHIETFVKGHDGSWN